MEIAEKGGDIRVQRAGKGVKRMEIAEKGGWQKGAEGEKGGDCLLRGTLIEVNVGQPPPLSYSLQILFWRMFLAVVNLIELKINRTG